jgi:hypothetical protein
MLFEDENFANYAFPPTPSLCIYLPVGIYQESH